MYLLERPNHTALCDLDVFDSTTSDGEVLVGSTICVVEAHDDACESVEVCIEKCR